MVPWNYTGFSATTGKTRKTVKCSGQKKNPKTKDYIEENPQTVQDNKTEKRQFSSAKTEPIIGQIHKTENPNAPLMRVFIDLVIGDKSAKFDRSKFLPIQP